MLGGEIGLLMNILFPKLDWDNENVPIKQGGAVLLTVLCAILYTVIQFLIVYFIPLPVNALIGICLAFTVVLSIASYLLVYFKGEEWLIKKLG
jgi:ABC-2 type transport system permease protein